jgi:xanthine/uracil permease
VRSAKTLLVVAVALVVLGLFTSFIAALTSRWGYIPSGVTVFVGMLNFAALAVGGVSIWRLLNTVEDLSRKVEELTKEE